MIHRLARLDQKGRNLELITAPPLSPRADAATAAAATIVTATAAGALHGSCSYEMVTVRDAVRNALRGRWDIPDFQRSFVYRRSDVCDIADSLWRDYPIGMILLWRTLRADGADRPRLWVVEGQQRMTSLCFLFGKTPGWWRAGWPPGTTKGPYDVRFDVEARVPPFFVVPAQRDAGKHRLVPLRTLLEFEDKCGRVGLIELARDIHRAGYCAEESLEDLCDRLARVRAVADRQLTTAVFTHQLADVLEIFERISGRGIRWRRLVLRILLRSLPGLRRWS